MHRSELQEYSTYMNIYKHVHLYRYMSIDMDTYG